jgi:hypothetical protein
LKIPVHLSPEAEAARFHGRTAWATIYADAGWFSWLDQGDALKA